MIDLHELRANRLGITFQETGPNIPLRLLPDTLLLRILFALTRPGKQVVRIPRRPVEILWPARKTFVGTRGHEWGNDDPDAIAKFKP